MRYLIAFSSLLLVGAGVAGPCADRPNPCRVTPPTVCPECSFVGNRKCPLSLLGPEHTNKILAQYGGGGTRAETVRRLGCRLRSDFGKCTGMLEALIDVLLFDTDPEARQAAAWGIGGLRTTSGAGILSLCVAAKMDPNERVRTCAEDGLKRLTADSRICRRCLYETANRLITQLQAGHYAATGENARRTFADAQAAWLSGGARPTGAPAQEGWDRREPPMATATATANARPLPPYPPLPQEQAPPATSKDLQGPTLFTSLPPIGGHNGHDGLLPGMGPGGQSIYGSHKLNGPVLLPPIEMASQDKPKVLPPIVLGCADELPQRGGCARQPAKTAPSQPPSAVTPAGSGWAPVAPQPRNVVGPTPAVLPSGGLVRPPSAPLMVPTPPMRPLIGLGLAPGW